MPQNSGKLISIEGGEGAGASHAREDGSPGNRAGIADGRIEYLGQFEHDLVCSFGSAALVERGQQIAPHHTKDRREDIEDADEDHHPHGGPFGGGSVGVGVEADQDMR